jgi:hypothetical protein
MGKHLKLKIKMDASTTEFSLFKNTNEYRELIDCGVTFQLQKKEERADKNRDKQDEKISFKDVLEEMIGEDEPLVKSLYEEIILEKIVLPFEL